VEIKIDYILLIPKIHLPCFRKEHSKTVTFSVNCIDWTLFYFKKIQL
jgi:hypothetical protein